MHLQIIFGKQVQLFKELAANWTKELGAEEAKRRLGRAVYLISIGGVDCLARSISNANDTIPEQQEYVDKVIETIFKDVKVRFYIYIYYSSAVFCWAIIKFWS